MGTLVRTIDDKVFDLDDVSDVQLLGSAMHMSGWGLFWVIFWVFLFFPVAFAVAYYKFGKRYTCAVKFTKSKRVYHFDETNYFLIQLKESD